MNDTLSFEKIRTAKDERFNIEYISQYELLLSLNNKTFILAVIDTLDGRCLYFEEFELLEVINLTTTIDELFESHHFLKAGYWKKIKFSQYNQKFTLIPNGLFVENNAFDYLDLVSDVKLGADKVMVYTHEKSGMTCVFSVDYEIYKWITAFYMTKKVQFIHPSSCEIEMLLTIKNQESREVIDLNFSETSFGLSYKKASKLEFANIFEYQTTEDVLYFIFAVFDSLHVDLNQLSCNFYGNIDLDSAIYTQVKNVVKNTKFGSKPKQIQFSHSFDEINQYRYNNLMALYLC